MLYCFTVFSLMKDGYTALMWAAQNGYQDIVSTLIASGAIVDAREKVSVTSMKGVKGIIIYRRSLRPTEQLTSSQNVG